MCIRDRPNAAYDYRLDQESQLGVLRQLGWVINYSNYRDYDQGEKHLARKIVATKKVSENETVTVTLITKSWK